MKKIFFSLFALLFLTNVQAQNKSQLEILDKFIVAHNLGTEAAIIDFIKKTYKPSFLKKIDLKKHIAFYDHIIKEFGPLNNKIYEVVEIKPTKFIINLIKKGESVKNKSIKPTEILMVKIDTDKNQPQYLSRGLGLGALACSIRKKG
ncbi:MAG TPA: hypothetical protein DCS93_09130 [Microscillaceae bacterium]|nr:hypothetical protein [Microscillaceae bacterium]